MSDSPALVYLEADDEITSVVRRVRSADATRVVVVTPGRSRATSSAVALRLLARAGEEESREVVVVGDPLTRSLAAEAGLPAFASIDEARSASLEAGDGSAPDLPRHAAIHVVRGGVSDETVATPAAAGAGLAPTIPTPRTAGPSDDTLTVPVPRRVAPRAAAKPRVRRPGSRGLATVLGVAAALLVVSVVAGATLLPSATITVLPRSEPVSMTYDLVVEDPVRREGTVEAAATITATGSYEILEPARGVVTFRNFNSATVEVPAGTLVAAGDQAFQTTESVAVPSGSLTGSGTILAGEAEAPIVASAAGPAGNVAADAIDTVLSEGVRDRLRLFPQNNSRLVLNTDPTSGGRDEAGPEITQADRDAALEQLRSELLRRGQEAVPDLGGLTVVDTLFGEPAVEVPDDVVGTRDQPEVEISGSLDWAVVAVDSDRLREDAAGRLASDPALPENNDLLDDSISVELAEPSIDGEVVTVEATVDGVTVPRIDIETVQDRVSGLTAEEARLALADLGEVDVILWPDWVESVPELDWRVTIRVEEPAP